MKRVWLVIIVMVLGLFPSEVLQAQTDDQLPTPEEQVIVGEVRSIIERYGIDVWPGWEHSVAPLLLRKGDYDYLIGHPAPPATFATVPDLMINDEPVLRMEGHLIPVPVATSWQVDDVWVAVAPVPVEFQQAIDEALARVWWCLMTQPTFVPLCTKHFMPFRCRFMAHPEIYRQLLRCRMTCHGTSVY